VRTSLHAGVKFYDPLDSDPGRKQGERRASFDTTFDIIMRLQIPLAGDCSSGGSQLLTSSGLSNFLGRGQSEPEIGKTRERGERGIRFNIAFDLLASVNSISLLTSLDSAVEGAAVIEALFVLIVAV
jgi:hypothetical protein